MAAQKSVKPFTYLLHAIIVFGLLGSEIFVSFLSRIVDGRDVTQVFTWPVNWYGAVFHWAVTIIIWSTGAFLLIAWANKRGVFPELVRFKLDKKAVWLVIGGAVLVVIYSLAWSNLAGYTVPQVYREYLGFTSMYGGNALIVSLFQNFYYAVELVLVVMMIAFFQRAGELWFKADKFPWGSIGLALTWGGIHFMTNPAGALGVLIWSLVPGIFYVLGNKNFYPAYLVLLLAFLI